MDLLCWPLSDQGGAAGECFQDAPAVLIARRDLTQAMSNHLGIGCELCSCRSKPASLVWQRGPSCFGNRRLLHAPRVWAGAFRPRVCGGPAGATRTFLGDRPFRATSEWLLVGSHHSVVSSRARAGVGLGFGGKDCTATAASAAHRASVRAAGPVPGAPPPAPAAAQI